MLIESWKKDVEMGDCRDASDCYISSGLGRQMTAVHLPFSAKPTGAEVNNTRVILSISTDTTR